jgi:hypothetical protein
MRLRNITWPLTSGRSVSVLFFLAPHGIMMYRRHQEKHPAHIVRNQRTEQGVGSYQRTERQRPTIYRWELGKALQEAALDLTWPDRDMSKVYSPSLSKAVISILGFRRASSSLQLIRRVECVHGSLPILVQCAPALNYTRLDHITTFIEDESIPDGVQKKTLLNPMNSHWHT